MSIWAGIKYALNSTLGTEKFLPLDEQIASQKTLYASDNVYLTLMDTGTELYDIANSFESVIFDVNKSVTMLHTGSLKLSLDYSMFKNSTYERQLVLHVYKNGTQIMAKDVYNTDTDYGSGTLTTDTIYLNRGDVLSFKYDVCNYDSHSNSKKYTISDIKILADLVDNVLLVKEV